MRAPGSAFEALPYELGPYAELHPARLALCSRLGGGPALPLDAPFRLLELGCGAGLSLVPLALEYPQAELVGVDREPVHIRRAAELRESLGVGSVFLHCAEVAELPAGLGRFDVIVAHRLYSHLEEGDRAALRKVVSQHLADDGLLVLSFNALPGWHLHGALREAVRYHTRSLDDVRTQVQQARALAGFLAKSVRPEEVVWHRMVTEQAQWIRQLSDVEVAHDLLAPINQPQTYEQVVEEFAGIGLTPVGDSGFVDRIEERLDAGVLSALRAVEPGAVVLQQAVDLCEGRDFRHTIFAREGAVRTGERALIPGVVYRGPQAELSRGSGGLLERIPAEGGYIPTHTLCRDPSEIAALIRLLALGLAEWWPAPRGFCTEVSERPCVTPAVRVLASLHWAPLPSARYVGVTVSPVERQIIRWLDGQTSVSQLASRLVQLVQQDVFRIQDAHGKPISDPVLLQPVLLDTVQETLERLARERLLVG